MNIFIILKGRTGDEMYFIDSGEVEIMLPDGRIVAKLSSGAYFGGRNMHIIVVLVFYKCMGILEIKLINLAAVNFKIPVLNYNSITITQQCLIIYAYQLTIADL